MDTRRLEDLEFDRLIGKAPPLNCSEEELKHHET